MKVLCLGWYGHSNLGDEAFKPAIQTILGPDAEISFVDRIPSDVNDYDALVIGGGSFLDQPLNTAVSFEEVSEDLPIVFLGVGIGKVHEANKVWLDGSRMIVARNEVDMEDVHEGPDLLFARDDLTPETSGVERLLMLPNGFSLPKRSSKSWEVKAWDWYETAMSGVLADFSNKGWGVSVQPMCASPGPITNPHDDRIAGARLMTVGCSRITVGMESLSEEAFVAEMKKASLVISSRFHGCVFATLLGVPFVGISAHSKVSSYFSDKGWKNYVDYYGFTAEDLELAIQAQPSPEEIRATVQRGRDRWAELSGIVQARIK